MDKNKKPYDMHYKHRKDTDTVEVYRNPNKFRLYFNGAKAARHNGNDIEVVTSLDHVIRVDKFGIRHW